MDKLRVGVDMDGVLVDLHSVWVTRYNEIYNDNLSVDDIDCWDWHVKTVPECQEKVYKILDEEELFSSLPVIEGSQRVLEKYNDKIEFWIVTAARNPKVIPDKHSWLKKYFSFLDPTKFMFVRDKSGFSGDILIDDHVDNLKTFGGHGILFTAPHNKNETSFIRANNWLEVDNLLDNILFWRSYNERTTNYGIDPRSAFNLLH